MKELIEGSQAVVRAAINAGCNFFAGYPITPSSEIAHELAKTLPKLGGIFIQMEDEIASINAIIGASMAGARSMTATSGPGLSLMQEAIGYAAITETPIVIIDVMRAGPATGIPTFPSQGDVQAACYGSHGDYPVVVLSPATIIETYYLTYKAFEIAERYLVPVIVLIDEITAHMKEGVELPPIKYNRYKPSRKFVGNGLRRHTTGLIHGEDGMPLSDPKKYHEIIKQLVKKIHDPAVMMMETEGDRNPEILFVTYGITCRAAKAAIYKMQKRGMSAGLVKLKTVFPFPEEEISRIIRKGVKKIIVPEMNMGQVLKEVQRIANNICEVISITSLARLMSPDLLIEMSLK